ncbi:hypothetical protein SAMD00019534_122250 [Acytostelium subglobosum LB1]|uniref:hypothetical protein n=1 Tax=Acytostelium subglobosum LB1 TaxID=1410327 RepID=UPI0006451C71|nr:hypothetical protein SAMD00019534_122250 [Acytostelium subglobosum LB1]GAM29049.1 hypothetical protein SAMD00019534_122250 [Acytostelium subglobosum LB1]|eukprot:XP_012748055.1 hypothetical protein SAMD00019534_122250 [Acytostelium subglobosum LB1]
MRELKFHEQKLLKKVNFVHWKKEKTKDLADIKKFGLSGKEEYEAYTKLVHSIQKIIHMISTLDEKDPVRKKVTDDLCDKLYDMGVIDTKSTASLITIGQAAFCRRRVSVLLVRLKFAQNLTHANTLVQHGHMRIGPEIVSDPAMLITRKLQDLLTWADGSSMRKKVMEYNDELDDYELLQ